MSVERLSMLQLVGRLEEMKDIVTELMRVVPIKLEDALKQIDSYSFVITPHTSNLDKTVDFNMVTSFEKENHYRSLRTELEEVLMEEGQPVRKHIRLSSLDPSERLPISDKDLEIAEEMVSDFRIDRKRKKDLSEELEIVRRDLKTIELFITNDLSVKSLSSLKYFDISYGTLTEHGRKTIRMNYENIPGAVIHLGVFNNEEAYLLISPKEVAEEIHRVKDSLGWKELPQVEDSTLENSDLKTSLVNRENELMKEISECDERILKKLYEIPDGPKQLMATIDLMCEVEEAKQSMAKSPHYFYLAGWIPKEHEEKVRSLLRVHDDLLIKILSDDEVPFTPPTKLKNNKLVRPFEALIRMYGLPNYREIDPTFFFALTYMFFFGAMFGDVGQGAVFALAGLYLEKKKHRPNLGGVLFRIGLASVFFGFMYGSVFGNEHLIPALLIKPFDDINTILIAAISFGILFLAIAYIIGIINKLRIGDLEEGLFGKEGLTGFIFFLSFLGVAVGLIFSIGLVTKIALIIFVLMLVLMLFRQPLARKIEKKKTLYEGSKADYYLESSFSLLETVLSVFSNTLSFIRIGAFAINHVGLFLAFQVMGNLLDAPTAGIGNVIMLILGNLLILGLEGLVVFVQGLRLEYYELFSKYYTGDGWEY